MFYKRCLITEFCETVFHFESMCILFIYIYVYISRPRLQLLASAKLIIRVIECIGNSRWELWRTRNIII